VGGLPFRFLKGWVRSSSSLLLGAPRAALARGVFLFSASFLSPTVDCQLLTTDFQRLAPLFVFSFPWVPHPCVFLGCGVFFFSAPQEAGASACPERSRRAPAQTTPKTILPSIPFSALTHAPVDFNRHERLFPLFFSVIPTGIHLLCPVCLLPGWPIFSSVRAARTSALERGFCVPRASPGRRDRGKSDSNPAHRHLNQTSHLADFASC